MSIKIKQGNILSFFGSPANPPSVEGRELLGGKGDALRTMAAMGAPVPPGFTVGTDQCVEYMVDPKPVRTRLRPQLRRGVRLLSKELGYTPLLSVRSGARVSMPGMMDTVLNVGLTSKTMPYWEERLGRRAMLDCRRRLVQMYGSVVMGVDPAVFEEILRMVREQTGVDHDSELGVAEMETVVTAFEAAYKEAVNKDFPDSAEWQLMKASEAVFKSWNNARAKHYRAMNNIPDTWGTAVNVQAMVFGNSGPASGTGVLFTRNPANGENELVGEFLQDAQGEDVVAGVRTPNPLSDMGDLNGEWPSLLADLTQLSSKLEAQYGDAQDIEFTVEDGTLWVLQTRSAKRTALAAFTIAHAMVEEGAIDKTTALGRVSPKQLAQLRRPSIDPDYNVEPHMVGLPACPGIVSGRVVRTAEEAVAAKANGETVVLVRHDTCPDDIAGMEAAVGILTSCGGATSHAAVVARAMNTACVVGAGAFDAAQQAADMVTIDGGTGRVWFNTEVPVVGGVLPEAAQEMVRWAYETTGTLVEDVNIISPVQRVSVAGWAHDSMLVEENLARAAAFNNTAGLVFDLTTDTIPTLEEDTILNELFGDTQEPCQGVDLKLVVEEIATAALKDAVVLVPEELTSYVSLLKESGYRIAREVHNLGDLLMSDGFVTLSDEFVSKVCGGYEAYDELLALLKKDGRDVAPVPVGKSVAEVAADVFTGEEG